MPIFKEVWSFRSGTSTWSDVWYSNSPSISAASGIGQTSLNYRLKLLSPLARLVKIRVSNLSNPRETVQISVNQVGTSAFPLLGPAPTTEAAVCTISSAATGSRRLWWCSGQQEESVFRNSTTGEDQINPLFQVHLSDWFAYLERNNYIVLSRIRVGNQGVFNNRILSADGVAANGQTILTMQQNPNVLVGDTVEISRVDQKLCPGLKGSFKVQLVTPSTITILYSTPQNALITLSSGNLKKLVYNENSTITAARCGFSFIGGRQRKNFATGSRGAKPAGRIRVSA